MSAQLWVSGQVYRCAWCYKGARVSGGLPYYTYVDEDGSWRAVPADPVWWTESDGICPAHLVVVRWRPLPLGHG